TAAGVEHEPARQLARRNTSLDLERRLVLLGPSHVIAVPLPAEAGDISLPRQPWNTSQDRELSRTGSADQLLGPVPLDLQLAPASGTLDQPKQVLMHVVRCQLVVAGEDRAGRRANLGISPLPLY